LVADVEAWLTALEGARDADAVLSACVDQRQRVKLSQGARGRRASTEVWMVTTLPRDQEGRPDFTMASTISWHPTREEALRQVHDVSIWEYYYRFAVIERVRPWPIGPDAASGEWFENGDDGVVSIQPPAGCEGRFCWDVHPTAS
jgi:hypothetical protein